MKYYLGLIFGGLFSFLIFVAVIYSSFPSGKIVREWVLDSNRGVAIQLREGEMVLHRLPWERRRLFYLVGFDQRGRSLPIYLYPSESGECEVACLLAVKGSNFEITLPSGEKYIGQF